MKTDLSGVLFSAIQDAERAAKHHIAQGDYGAAAKELRRCYELSRQYAEYGTGPTVKRMRLERAEQYLAKATQFSERAEQGAAPAPLPPISERAAGDDYEAVAEALITSVDVGWDDIGGLDVTKADIQTSYAMGLVQIPPGVMIQANRNLLLYGPPGTGKTMLAGAISKELDATFFNTRIPDLLSQYFGESSKLLHALYAVAATHAPSVVFLDEIDALSRQRGGSQESGAERRLLNTFLNELDGLQHKGGDVPFVLTVGATNVPWELDRAILSRFSGGRIYIPLPDDAARRAILAIYIDRHGHTTTMPEQALVQRTDGYSGREIQRIVTLAVQSMLNRTNPALLTHAAGGQDALRRYELVVNPLSEADFERAFTQVRPAMNDADIGRFEQWHGS